MLDKIKRLIGIILIIFCVVAFIIFIMMTWDVMSKELAIEALIKVAYTFGAVVIISLVVLVISKAAGGK